MPFHAHEYTHTRVTLLNDFEGQLRQLSKLQLLILLRAQAPPGGNTWRASKSTGQRGAVWLVRRRSQRHMTVATARLAKKNSVSFIIPL